VLADTQPLRVPGRSRAEVKEAAEKVALATRGWRVLDAEGRQRQQQLEGAVQQQEQQQQPSDQSGTCQILPGEALRGSGTSGGGAGSSFRHSQSPFSQP